MTGLYDSTIIRFIARVQAPVLQLYALYVLVHGHYGPGGAFQAGAVLAGSFLLPRLVEGQEAGARGLSTRGATLVAVAGASLFAGIGVLMILLGGVGYMDYSALENLPFAMPPGGETRAIGSLVIEVGVALTVMGVLVIIYDDVVAPPPPDEMPPEDTRTPREASQP